MSGFFITFEGGEGVGKSTQIRCLYDYLSSQDYVVVMTREPGGTRGGEEIRALLVEGGVDKWHTLDECLLMNAARAVHIREVIKPALQAGQIVLCDRFIDSTRAYQAGAGDIPLKDVLAIENVVARHVLPDLTFVFDLPIEIGLARAADRGKADRFESKGEQYHQNVRHAFREITRKEPERCMLIDASMTVEEVSQQIVDSIIIRLSSSNIVKP